MQDLSKESMCNCIILDIGGTLAKLCFVSNNEETSVPHDNRLTSMLHL
jgi:hypothetical protein